MNNVLYVHPNGVCTTIEMDHLQALIINQFKRLRVAAYKAAITISEGIKSLFNSFKKSILNNLHAITTSNKSKSTTSRPFYITFSKKHQVTIKLRSQVVSRKPMVSRARSYC
ncbi:hypothetical protein BTR22_19125 [Alkalihalophilus pseudofirmus]|nr:hypothetical protein BTR22_19125 [Alkalihalophilus pseudofirmus]